MGEGCKRIGDLVMQNAVQIAKIKEKKLTDDDKKRIDTLIDSKYPSSRKL